MMTSMSIALADKRVPVKWVSRTGLRLFLPLMILSVFTGCYHAPYREASRTVSKDVAVSQKAPVAQVFFYPKSGQTTEQQSRDHFECYNWAIKQTGFDPNQSSIPAEQRVRVVPMPPPGHDTAALAIAGAVLGALIAGPRRAGAGALIGAGGGLVAGAASDASRERYTRHMEEAYVRRDQEFDSRNAEKAHGFRRAMSACLEGRGYSVQ